LPSVASLISYLGRDVKNLVSLESALVVGGAGGASLALTADDAGITRRFSGWAGESFVLRPGDVAGELALQSGAAFAVFIIGRVVEDRRVAALGADLVRAQILNTAATHGTKLIVRRRRPDGARFSFPSGHSSATFATATVLQGHLGWKAGLPAYVLAVYTATSRVGRGKHYPSDVLFGSALGIVMGRAVTVPIRRTRLGILPTPVPGGIGVALVNLP
jgi:membrane-associated phospholipid phosphatase